MHGYKWPINCTRTRTENELKRLKATLTQKDRFVALFSQDLERIVHSLDPSEWQQPVHALFRKYVEKQSGGSDAIDAIESALETQVMRASKMYVNPSHAWFKMHDNQVRCTSASGSVLSSLGREWTGIHGRTPSPPVQTFSLSPACAMTPARPLTSCRRS